MIKSRTQLFGHSCSKLWEAINHWDVNVVAFYRPSPRKYRSSLSLLLTKSVIYIWQTHMVLAEKWISKSEFRRKICCCYWRVYLIDGEGGGGGGRHGVSCRLIIIINIPCAEALTWGDKLSPWWFWLQCTIISYVASRLVALARVSFSSGQCSL